MGLRGIVTTIAGPQDPGDLGGGGVVSMRRLATYGLKDTDGWLGTGSTASTMLGGWIARVGLYQSVES